MHIKKPKRKINIFPLIVVFAVVVFVFFLHQSGLIFNTTASMPIGIYYTYTPGKIARGDIVTVMLPEEIQAFGVKRKYIKNMESQLIKKVIAVPGDNVKLTAEAFIVNGKRYPAPMHKYDLLHRKLDHIKRGDYVITRGYWLYGAGDFRESWDSRYFGFVKRENIKKKAVAVLTF